MGIFEFFLLCKLFEGDTEEKNTCCCCKHNNRYIEEDGNCFEAELLNTHLLFKESVTCAQCGDSYEYNPNKGDYYDLCDKCSEEQYKSDWLTGKYGEGDY